MTTFQVEGEACMTDPVTGLELSGDKAIYAGRHVTDQSLRAGSSSKAVQVQRPSR